MSDGQRVLTCYYRPKPGGLCRRLYRGMEALAEAGHQVHYLAVEELPLRHPGCRFHRLRVPVRRRSGALFWFWFMLAAPPLLLWLGWRHKVERLFVFGAFYGLLMQPLRLARRLPLAVLLRADSIANHRLAGWPRWRLAVETVVEAAALAGARVHAVSAALAAVTAARHPRAAARLGVLPNDVPPPFAEPAGGSAAEGPLRTAAVGVLEARKNLPLLLAAVQPLAPHELRLTFYGEGPAEAELRRRAGEAASADRVRFAGWRAPREIWSEVDLLLMPSRHEGAPNAVLEALAHHVPVLASDLPEHREILPASSLLPVDDAAAWSERLRRLAAPSRRALGELAREQQAVAGHLRFDWDAAFVAVVEGDPEEER